MFSKIFKVFIIFYLFFRVGFIFALENEDIKIISRQEWGADESYRYIDSKYWQDIIKKWQETPKKELTQEQIKKAKLEALKVKIANEFLIENYSDIIGVRKIEKYDGEHKLAWPIARAKNRNAIVIHHTNADYKGSYEAVRKIYKYHALTRAWGDIGYNYLIGYNGEIFEGRAGGDDVVAAHDKWNNQSAIGIAIIGSYDNKDINKKQYESLKKLIKFLVKKYNINLNKKVDFFKWCVGTSDKCLQKPLIITRNYPIIGHKDAGHTACPGKKLYQTLQKLKKDLGVGLKESDKNLLRKINRLLYKTSDRDLLTLLYKIDLFLEKNKFSKKSALLEEVKESILRTTYNRTKNDLGNKTKKSFDDNNKIKVKLSYPFSDFINLQVSGKYKVKLIKNNIENKIVFYKGGNYKKINLNFKIINNKVFLENKEIGDFSKIKFIRISVPSGDIIKISSWDRKPKWDKTGKLNDNEFKGDIIFYKKNGKFIVVNELYLNDYLKGLGEVSNYTNPEKIKAIIVLARTYARWYMTKARKFVGEWYDASDDPNIFQKYLGFGIEKRSPNVVKIVESTKDLVVTYNGDLIKPWYFSSSNGKTVSFIEYCKKAKGVPDCAHPEKFPFLLGVLDPGGVGKIQAGHGVGVSGSGLEYFSKLGVDFGTMIRYFLKGVRIKYL